MSAGSLTRSGDWPGDQLDLLRKLWADGKSGAVIAVELSKIGPARTKNAVVGKAHRLNLPARPSPIVPRDPSAPPRAVVPKPKPVVPMIWPPPDKTPSAGPPREAAPPGAGVGAGAVSPTIPAAPAPPIFRRVSGTMAPRAPHRACQWPMNNGAPWRFCGDPRWDGTRQPYCETHARLSRAKARDGEEAA